MLTLEGDWLQVTTIHGKICMIQAVSAFKQMEESRGRHNKSLRNESANYRLSDFSIQGAELPDVEEILSYEGSTMTDLLLPSDEKLSFILDGNQVKGFTLATDTRPIMAGESGSELFELHEKIKAELGEDVNLTYVFYAGGFIFVAVDQKGQESVWLDRRAATILNVSPSTPYAPEEILEHIQKGAKAAVTSKSKSKPEEL